jgi:carbonic anhydrase/acetyltransferase-like protein (isoleucine patch superfamily)
MKTNISAFRGIWPKLGEDVFIAAGAHVIGRVHLSDQASIWYNAVLRGDVQDIIIGARTNIQDLSMIHATTGICPTVIGDDVTVGHRAILHGCTIGHTSLIGMGAIILDEAEVGEFSLVGAGALITPGKKFPPRSVIMGAPGRVVRQTTDEEVQGFLDSAAHYSEMARFHAG